MIKKKAHFLKVIKVKVIQLTKGHPPYASKVGQIYTFYLTPSTPPYHIYTSISSLFLSISPI